MMMVAAIVWLVSNRNTKLSEPGAITAMVDDFEEHTCGRIIRQSKYERQSPETFNWWLRLFQLMESEFTIPLYRRKQVVRQIFPDKIFKKIVSLLTLVDDDLSNQKLPPSTTSVKTAKSEGVTPSNLTSEIKNIKNLSREINQKKDAGPKNPYLRFFKRNPERAAIWRDLPPLSPDEMNLTQKAEAITEAIAVDFINWIQKLGGETGTTLDVEQVMKMFEIGFNTHAATSLQATIKEMPAVPRTVAEARGFPERTVQALLHKKMKEDMRAFSRKPRKLAFGTTLPYDLRIIPPKVDPTERWTKAKTDERLKSMAAVWEGITELRSTRAFCKWLIDHPDLPAPKYLESLGMIQPSFFDQPHYSVDIQDAADQDYSIPGFGTGLLQTDTK